MTGYVDIHAHLLPGIDDGPADLAGSLEMARAAAAAGIATLVATPHLRPDFPDVHVHELAGRCEAMRKAIDDDSVPLDVVTGAEVSLAWALDASDEQLRLASIGQRGTDLLIETPDDVHGIERLLFALAVKRYRLTLAHPERSRQFQAHPEQVEALTDRGVLLEVNAEALLRSRRSATGRLAERLCANGHVSVLASDGHRAGAPRPVAVLAQGAEAAAALVGPDRARWMTSTAPASIVAGRALPAPPDVRSRGGSWRRLARLGGAAAAGSWAGDGTANGRPATAGDTAPAAPDPPDSESRAPVATASARPWRPIVLLAPLAAVAVASFAIVRSQQSSGATLAARQHAGQSLTRGAVERVVRSAPDPATHGRAIDASCTAGRSGPLRNPWRCTLTYAHGKRLRYQVHLFGNGTYIGANQVVLKPGARPYRAPGTISGCCIAIP
jgi:protein-tyrosine phosphatase